MRGDNIKEKLLMKIVMTLIKCRNWG